MFQNARSFRFLRTAAFPVLLALVFTTLSFASGPSSLTWTQLNPATTFSGRAGFATAYDPISKKVVLFGGLNNSEELNDTWTFDGTNWEQLQPAVSPGPRADATMAYDSKTHKLVMFGGFAGFAFLNETWLWDGATSTWTQAQPATVPTGATNPIMFTDPVNGRADMFGGYEGQFFSRSMYQWNGTDWRLVHLTVTPYPRAGAVVAYDPIRKNVVLFGGLSDNWVMQNTWTWDGHNWTERTPAHQPPPIYFSTGAFDSTLGSVVFFSGGTNGIDQRAMWAWNGSDWKQISAGNTPPVRELFGTIWDPVGQQFLIFGGTVFNTNIMYSDIWSLSVN
jgi:hypothetical protein